MAGSIPNPDRCGGGGPAADAELVARAKASPAAFDALYRRYLGPVYAYCRLCLRSREDAEDATAQTFLRAVDQLRTCRDGSFRSWLFAIAANVVRNAVRDRRPMAPLAEAPERPDPAGSPEDAALAAEEREQLLALLDGLTTGQREVVALRLGGLSGPEIADALGMSHSAVKVAQFRAFARLRSRLATGSATDHAADPDDEERAHA